MKTLTPTQAAYVAGFLDGDGSIFVCLKPNAAYRYGFQIALYVVFFQSQKELVFLERLKELLGVGYVRLRNDGIAELTIGSIEALRDLIQQLDPYLVLKKQQAQLLVEILERKDQVKSYDDFVALVRLIDQYGSLNYSKKRTITFERVAQEFKQSDNPVETCSLAERSRASG
jgi:hypothetical protein